VTEEEVLDLIVAFVQLYRENAKYLDRPYKWVAKVGLDWVKERVVEDTDNRSALIARFDHSQTIYQTDPWAARANDQVTEAWGPMADLTLEAAE
ncbi:MAG: nitrite reductase large subunit, partial [Pseudomonadota bacterium]